MQLDLTQIRLKTNWIKRKDSFLYFPVVESTIAVAHKRYHEERKEDDERKIIFADSQTGGVGSYDKKWLNIPYKDIALTITLGKSFDFKQQLVDDTCQAVINTLKNWNLDGYIKKPNDVYINNRKISGILLSNYWKNYTKYPHQYLSVGLNVNSNTDIKTFDEKAKVESTSFFRETGELCSREKILNHLISQIDIAIQKQGYQ